MINIFISTQGTQPARRSPLLRVAHLAHYASAPTRALTLLVLPVLSPTSSSVARRARSTECERRLQRLMYSPSAKTVTNVLLVTTTSMGPMSESGSSVRRMGGGVIRFASAPATRVRVRNPVFSRSDTRRRRHASLLIRRAGLLER